MTLQQLRTTNLIFLEHEKFSKEIPIYKQQIKHYQMLDSIYNRHDSLQNKQLQELNDLIEKQNTKIKKMHKFQNYGIGAIIALIVGLICK